MLNGGSAHEDVYLSDELTRRIKWRDRVRQASHALRGLRAERESTTEFIIAAATPSRRSSRRCTSSVSASDTFPGLETRGSRRPATAAPSGSTLDVLENAVVQALDARLDLAP